jgi:hypothetical protein
MTADADIVAESVRTAFAGGFVADPRTVSQDVDALRVHALDLKDLDKLKDWDHASPLAKAIKVYVRANPERVSNAKDAPRGFVMVQYPIQVAIMAKPKTTTDADVGPLKHLAQELRSWFYKRGRSLPGRDEAIEGNPEVLLDADAGSLQGARLFLSEFIITFSGMRPK